MSWSPAVTDLPVTRPKTVIERYQCFGRERRGQDSEKVVQKKHEAELINRYARAHRDSIVAWEQAKINVGPNRFRMTAW